MSTTFAEIERERGALIDERGRRVIEHGAWISECDLRLRELSQRAIALTEGVDLSRVDRARKVLYIEGDCLLAKHVHEGDSRANAVANAKRLLADNPARLRSEYIGVKNYSGFGDQREDHKYGYGPRHGHIVFSIGLTQEARQRDLTPEEIEDALYLLHVLPALARAQKQAA